VLVNQIHTSSPPVSDPDGDSLVVPPLLPNPGPCSADHSKHGNHAVARMLPSKSRRQWSCAERHCSCSCHRTARTSRRFWALEYTPLDVFREACDDKSCNATKYGGTFSFALSQLGIRRSAIIQFYVLVGLGKFSFRPVFDVVPIVPYTSPGFEALWRCEEGLITVEEARDRLVGLYQSDPYFRNHVNPNGESYIEVNS
jgi:hypothetical protein